MIYLETYDKLRKEMKRLLFGDDASSDEQDVLVGLPSFPTDSSSVLCLAKTLKEEGNSFFKLNMVDDALEKYGYAGVILARHEAKKEDDIDSFFKLAICILLNFTACLSRQNEFVQLGQICSIILEFDPNNVKAMFRRALAALEIGRKNWAYWDLLMAAEVEPKNVEISTKLEEVKNSINASQSQGDIPRGLGIGISSPKKKFPTNLGLENRDNVGQIRNHLNFQENCERGAKSLVGMDESQRIPSVEDKTPQRGSIVEDKKDMINNMDLSKEKVIEDVKNVCRVKNDDQAEPKCRFVNRRRPGSSISISRKDIQDMMKGKTIQYFNSRSGSRMTIRVVTDSSNGLKKNETNEEVKSDSPSTVGGQPFSSKMFSDNFPMSSNQEKEDMVMEDRVHKPSVDQPSFSFKQYCSLNVGIYNGGKSPPRKSIVKVAKRLKLLHKGAKKNAKVNCVASTSFSPNFVFGCRYHIGMKRKVPPEDIHHNRPRKQLHLCYDSKLLEHSSSMYVVECLGVRVKNVCNVLHDIAIG